MSLALKGFKLKVVEKCLDSVQVKLSQLEVEKSKIQDSANNETKSSMGDKYETGRAMAQNEIGKLELNILDCRCMYGSPAAGGTVTTRSAVRGSMFTLSSVWFSNFGCRSAGTESGNLLNALDPNVR